jgi:hypothetical protein
MSEHVSAVRELWSAFKILQGKLKEKCHLDERGINGRILLQ